MPTVSNSTAFTDALEARTARVAEIETAVAILLGTDPAQVPAENIHNFVSMAAERGLNLDDLWICQSNGKVLWVMLPVISPGKTMLLLSPPWLPKNLPMGAVQRVVDAACGFHQRGGIELAQLLIDPAAKSMKQVYVQLGFTDLAELIYLQREVKKIVSLPPLPPSIQMVNYSPELHGQFVQTIARSYEQSLDCPGLSGMRDMEDVVTGHKGVEFNPDIWFLMLIDGQPAGVLLMGTATHANALELVYLGLVPEARGKGLGDILVNLALLTVYRQNRSDLTLAVDSRNTPATRLYYRHGLKKVGTRAALVKRIVGAYEPGP
jgi:ribosomal protein S18 acetylase RimI-like enzyme